MFGSLRQRSVKESAEDSSTDSEQTDAKPITQTTFFRLGRLVYGGVLISMALDGLLNTEERAQYAEAKNIPLPTIANISSHALLLTGGIGISLWRSPRLSASAIITFFLGVTPMMHDFWSIDDPKQKQQQMTDFLKNTALLGAALLLLGVAERE